MGREMLSSYEDAELTKLKELSFPHVPYVGKPWEGRQVPVACLGLLWLEVNGVRPCLHCSFPRDLGWVALC